MITATDLWAPFALRLRCGPLAMQAVSDADLPALVDLALAGIHPPGAMPFLTPWTEAPTDEIPANTAAYYWSQRAGFRPDRWALDLVVRLDGEVVGVQGIATENYRVTRSGETGSWLGRRFQGRGIGTAMRRVMCAFVFDHLDAEEITSAAFDDNPASAAVSRKVGYVDNGATRLQRRPGELARQRRFVLTPERLRRPESPLQVEGLAPLRRAIGLDQL